MNGKALALLLAVVVGAVACDSGPTGPEERVPTTIDIDTAPAVVTDSVCASGTFGAGGFRCLRWRYFPADSASS